MISIDDIHLCLDHLMNMLEKYISLEIQSEGALKVEERGNQFRFSDGGVTVYYRHVNMVLSYPLDHCIRRRHT